MRKVSPIHVLAAGVLVLVALAAACGGQEDDSGTGGAADGFVAGGEERAPGPADSEIPSQDGDSSPLPDLTGRKIVRSATLDLSVDSITAAVSEIGRIARAAGGFVSESNVFVAPGEERERTQTATVTIRVPAEAFEDVMEQLRGTAHELESETSRASEVTEEYTDLQARLKNLEAALERYRTLFERAEGISEVLTVQERIDAVQLEIERVQGRLQVLNDLTELATITVNLSLPPVLPDEGGQNWAVEALETSWEVSQDALVVLGTVAIATAVLMVWLVPISIVSVVAWRLFGRRLAHLARRLYEA